MSRIKERLESKLTVQQRKAAALLVANEWGELTEDGKKKTQAELAEVVGVTRGTLYTWRQDDDFIAYVNLLTDRDLNAMRTVANAQLMSLIKGDKTNGIASVKALEMFYKRHGLLTDRQVVETVTDGGAYESDEDIEKGIAEVDAILAEG
ncbi:phBC6A51 family helix-turn-helix protein [Cohnella lupini]|uniref:Putative insertion element HTH domain-containing protein n=1 Tax=Cohnella lupini TaxID=1294267 RepID=A0A3D9I692_9BACL|nr:phBC6A51 family helix-turn-helix protein [Cohnella lupini]RED57165.1 putative insertion element HTH domain-containing protein [Cohnella lupini]